MESMQGGSGFLNEYLYVGGQRVARVANLGPIYYYYGDHLGTARLITDGGGTKCYDADYFPWGEEQQIYVNTCPQNYKFTGKERRVGEFGERSFMRRLPVSLPSRARPEVAPPGTWRRRRAGRSEERRVGKEGRSR